MSEKCGKVVNPQENLVLQHNNDKVSLASTQTAVPTAIPTAVAEAPVVSLVANNGTIESQMPALMIGLDPTQRNSISMLNHLAVLTQEINASQNSRIYYPVHDVFRGAQHH